MPVVFDPQTQKPVDGSPEELAAGIVAGKYGLDGAAGPVALRGKDGSIYHAAPDKVATALSTGAYSLLSADDELKHQVAQEEQAKGLGGSLAAAGSSAVNQLTLGAYGALEEAGETPERRARREASEEYHSTARLAGGAAGVVGSLAFGGEVFKGVDLAGQAVEHGILPAAKAAEAGLAARLASKAAGMATQGALLSSPQALVQAIAGDPKKAAETLMWGIGAGAALGGVGELFSSAAKGTAGRIGEKIGEKLQDPETSRWLDDKANEWTARAYGAQKSQVAKEGEANIRSAVNFAYEEGLIKPGMSRADLGEVLDNAESKWGGKIGSTIDSLDSIVKAPKPLPEVLDAALKPTSIGDAIRSNLDSAEMRMPMNADQASALKMVADSADLIPTIKVNGQDVVPFDEAQKFVSGLRSKWAAAIKRSSTDGGMKGLETVTALDRVKESAYQFARDAVHDAADQVAVASDNTQLKGELVAAKRAYAKLSTLEKFAQNYRATQAGNRGVSLTDFVSFGKGPASMIGSAIGAAVGSLAGPGGAVVGSQVGKIPGAALDFFAKKWAEDKGLVAISAIAKRAAKEGPEVFSAVMASEGAKRLEATMGGVRDAVRSMAVRGIEGTGPRNYDHMRHFLGGSVQGLSQDQQHSKLAAKLTALASNPEAMVASTANASAPFAAGSPALGDAYQAQVANALQYLHAAVPKPVTPPAPFEPDDWTPSDAEKMAFHDKAEVVSNPMAAVDHMRKGTLSDAHIDALQANYPRIYEGMRNEVLQFSAEHPEVKLPLAERQSVSKFLGSPIDTVSKHLPALQATYAPKTQSQGQPPGSKAPKGKIKNMPSAASAFTGSQGPSSTGA